MTTNERKKHRIIFMGTPDFAVASLRALHTAGFNIVGVLTTPAKAAGRGLKTKMCAVHTEAEALGIPVCAPESLRDNDVVKTIEHWNADLGVVVAFKKLPEAIFTAPRLGTFNLHASLLPDYRGAAPINRAIMNGEVETGVTTFLLNDRIDEGGLFFQKSLKIGKNETAGELHDRLMDNGADLVVKTADAYLNQSVSPKPQANASNKKAPKIFREDTRIDWSKSVHDIHNHIRGLSPYPAAYTKITSPKSTEVKIYQSEIIEATEGFTGVKHTRNSTWTVDLRNGKLSILDIQPKGKRRMPVSDWLNGLPNGKIITE